MSRRDGAAAKSGRTPGGDTFPVFVVYITMGDAHDPEKPVPVFGPDHAQTRNDAQMKPKTMLEMAGLTPVPPPLSDSTVVVIDAQREYVDGKLPLVGIEPALAEIGRLLGRARALQVPIIHIVHQGRAA